MKKTVNLLNLPNQRALLRALRASVGDCCGRRGAVFSFFVLSFSLKSCIFVG